MEEKKLELRLGPPGDDHSALISLGYYINSSNSNSTNSTIATCGTKRGLINTLEVETGETRNWLTNSKSTVTTANTVVPDSSEKRMAIDTVVGWPPIGSFRKNLSTGSSSKGGGLVKSTDKVSMDSRDRRAENLDENRLFVKIHMDGVPIGRKIDLKSYDNYETLSSAVDELFGCLLAAAQKNHHYCAKVGEEEVVVETKGMISTGLLDGSGEYTLVYEDHEGDRMLVGDDVPWHMFVSTAKRLRVLKRSELPSLQEISSKSQSGLVLLQQRHEGDRVNPN